GAVGQVAHLPVLRKLPGVEVAAICDNDVSKAQALAARFEVKDTFDDIEEVLRYSHADVVAICTPNHLHEIHAVAALAAGCHVLCERPLALTVAGVERVLRASEKYGKRVMVGMNHRFRSDVQAVRGFLAGGDLGVLQAIRGGWHTFQPSRHMVGWRLRRQEAGGGAFLDLGLQLLDLGLWLAGWPAPKRVSAHASGQTKDAVEDMATALVVCENGVSLTLDVSWRHMGEAERFWFDLVGTKGSASVQPLRVFKELHGTVTDVTPTGASGRETPFAQSYRAEWTYFLAVMRGDVNAPPPRDQLALHRVLDAVYRSADEGRDVLLWHFTPLSALGYLATITLFGLWHALLFWLVVRVRLQLTAAPLWLVFPVVWTAVEWAVGHQGDIRFPWLGLGTSLGDAIVLVQWADLAGARGVTLWLAWCSVMLVEAMVGDREQGGGRRTLRWRPVVAVLAL